MRALRHTCSVRAVAPDALAGEAFWALADVPEAASPDVQQGAALSQAVFEYPCGHQRPGLDAALPLDTPALLFGVPPLSEFQVLDVGYTPFRWSRAATA